MSDSLLCTGYSDLRLSLLLLSTSEQKPSRVRLCGHASISRRVHTPWVKSFVADLLLVYPKAKVEGNYITALHYIVIVKLFLYKLKLSQNRIEGVPHPRAIARLLCRLSRELKSAPSFEPDTRLNRFLDPADYDGCLGEMLKDMEEYINTVDTPSLSDGYVYVRRGTDTYAQSLLAAADELNSSTSRGKQHLIQE